MADLISSMDQQVIFHQVATIPSLQTVPTTVFKRTRSKIRSSKLLSRSRKWIKSSSTSKLLVDAKPNSDFNSRGPKLDCVTKEVQNLLLDDIIQQVLPNRYSKCIFNSNAFTVPKLGTTLHLPRLLHGKTRYQERLPPHVCRSTIHKLIPLHGNGRKTMPFGLSTAPRIFAMLLRHVIRMLRDINVSVIAYLDDLLIVGSTKEECAYFLSYEEMAKMLLQMDISDAAMIRILTFLVSSRIINQPDLLQLLFEKYITNPLFTEVMIKKLQLNPDE
ncbi:hypothetical protein ACTFIW_010437 [Dictyostelium discoideum]